MTPDHYLAKVLDRYRPGTTSVTASLTQSLIVEPAARRWAGTYLRSVSVTGSIAKGTAVGGQTDLDLLISLSHDTPGGLREIYWGLYGLAEREGWYPRAQNVSVGTQIAGHKVDLVPGRLQPGAINRHSLYRRKADSWTKTNVQNHIALVSGSGRLDEIRLTKIWRGLHGLEFPSLTLELAVLEAVRGRHTGALANNFLAVLEYLRSTFPTARLLDPANTNNVVSDDLTNGEKTAVAAQARRSLSETDWGRVVW